MKVNILTDKNFVSFFFFYPLLVNLLRMRELGVEFFFSENLDSALWDADIVLLDSKVSGWIRPVEHLLEILASKQDATRSLVWLDSSASSGTTHFEVLPIVDAYWKRQYLYDLDNYTRPVAGARIFTDYYQRNFNAEIENQYEQYPLDMEYKDKLFLSWNLGVGGYGLDNRIGNVLRRLPWNLKKLLKFKYRGRPSVVSKKRRVALAFRGSDIYSNSALACQRLMTIKKMEERGLPTSSLPYSKYLMELENARMAISPFGFGEVCYRDFEIFFSGAALVKPSMEHLSTYPDFYKAKETYLPFAWDFSDFDQIVDQTQANPKMLEEVADAGQKILLDFRSESGQEFFCVRLMKMLMALQR